MSAEELKGQVRRYADEHFPGWACAGVSIRVGEIGGDASETLLVLPVSPPPPPTSSSEPAGTRG